MHKENSLLLAENHLPESVILSREAAKNLLQPWENILEGDLSLSTRCAEPAEAVAQNDLSERGL